jgi:hypothetical protein
MSDGKFRICTCLSTRVFYHSTFKEHICLDCWTLYPLSKAVLEEAREKFRKRFEDEDKEKLGTVVFKKQHYDK